MKKLLLLLCSLLISFNSYGEIGCSEKDDMEHLIESTIYLQKIGHLFYLPNQSIPYSGENLCVYDDSSGQYFVKGEIKKGKLHGKLTSWRKDGQKKIERIFKDGNLEKATLYKYYDNNHIKSVEKLENNRSTGLWTYWHENGQKQSEQNFISGKKDGKSTYWHDNGQKANEENFKNGSLVGNRYSWSENGLMMEEGFFLNGARHGKNVFYYDNGQKYAEQNYKENSFNGKSSYWSANGQIIFEKFYKDGSLVNTIQYKYYDNNNIKIKQSFKNNRLHGKWIYYLNANGKKFIEGTYKDDKPDGKWIFWDRGGRKIEELNYKFGDLVNKTIFKYTYFTGQLKSKKKYKDGECISGDC
jgi:uncharacterized protein